LIDGLKGGASFGLYDSNNNGAGASAAGATYAAVTAEVTGRLSMGTRDPVQCRQPDGSAMTYTGDEEINGKPIAGVDGVTTQHVWKVRHHCRHSIHHRRSHLGK
jgi:hypothetical protein